MRYRTLGQTEIEVSVVALGCWALTSGDFWGDQDETDSVAVIDAALDAGVNFLDTAERYGDGASEAFLGRTLGKRSEQLVLASKILGEHLGADQVGPACEASLKRLKRDYLDLYQIHWPNRNIPVAETMGALQQLQQQGKVRAIGVSTFGVNLLDEVVAAGGCAANQVAYSLLLRGIEFNIAPKCLAADITILSYSPLAQSLLTGKFQNAREVPDGRARSRHFSKDRPLTRHGEDGCERQTFEAIEQVRQISAQVGQPMSDVSLAWVLYRPGVTSVVAGARNARQARDNARAGELQLTDDVIAQLDGATEPVKQYLGPSADAWEPVANARVV